MYIWLGIAAIGCILALTGIGVIMRRYHQGKVSLLELWVTVAGFILFVSIGILGEVVWRDMPAPLFIALLPLWFAAISLARRRRA